MRNKIVISLLTCVLALNIGGCGCGVPASNIVENETEIIVNTEDVTIEEETTEVIEETEVIEAEVTEESTEETVTETPQEEEEVGFGFNVTDCAPHTKYTNTNCNIRSIPDKSGELVNTAVINTELTVTGTTDNGWSRVETLGMVAYIKSSLLSDTKTKVQTQQTAPSQSQSSQPSGGTQTQSQPQAQETPSQPQQTEPTQPQQTQPQTPAQNEPDLGALFGDTSQGGAGGSIGTTGTNSVGYGGGY